MGDFIKHMTLAKILVQPDIALFKGLNFQQHDGIAAICDEWNRRGQHHPVPVFTDQRALAYILATVYHETARTMQPIEEYGKGAGRSYGVADATTGQVYYGRGFVQLTWKDNYLRFQNLLHIPLVDHPELACDLLYATQILFEGMGQGLFTGKKLYDYFNETKCDWVNARRIINGTDKADVIAGYAEKFFKAIHLSNTYLNGSETV